MQQTPHGVGDDQPPVMISDTSRWSFALRWASTHLLISLSVAGLAAALVFGLWYPSPWRQILGVTGLFGLIVVVDVVCGPLLTLVLASPKKSRRERWVDLSLVALIQLAALGYGLWSVFSARPVILAFEVDRMVVVTANEVQIEDLDQAPAGLQRLPWTGVRSVGLRKIKGTEVLQSVDASLQGVSPAMRPGWWRPVNEAHEAMSQRARPLADLMDRLKARSTAVAAPDPNKTSVSEQRAALEEAVAQTGQTLQALRFLPLTSSKNRDWIVLLDASGSVLGYAPVDGFE